MGFARNWHGHPDQVRAKFVENAIRTVLPVGAAAEGVVVFEVMRAYVYADQ